MSYFILADCNNFYASCERLFSPRLENRAVVILSNNDGCVIARSQEAKALGLKMGDPYFKIKDFCKQARVMVHSSNYKLYGDISRRIMTIFSEMAPEMQIYSIDEAFLKYPSTLKIEEIFVIADQLRNTIKRWVGIPISLGIGPTKTLAKVANALAKKHRTAVFSLCSKETRAEIFKTFPIEDVWGIGRGYSKRLNAMGIYTIADFLKANPIQIRSKMGVVLERMHYELRGICCLDLEEVESKKSITCSRSFGQALTEESDISEALSTFAARASEKLRRQKSYAKAIYVFLEKTETNFDGFQRLQTNSEVVFEMPTDDTSKIITASKECLKKIFRPNQRYKKCGIILVDLVSEENIVPDLFFKANPKSQILMQTVDALNKRFGKNKVFFGATLGDNSWKMRADFLSPHHTTDWKQLPIVKA